MPWGVAPSLLESLCGLRLRPCFTSDPDDGSPGSKAKLRRPDGRCWRYPWLPAVGDSWQPWHMAGLLWSVLKGSCLKQLTGSKASNFVEFSAVLYRDSVTIAWKKKFGITKPPEEAKAFPPSRSTPRKLSTKMDLAVNRWVKAWTTEKMG